jgi:hypothetical protein
MKQGRRLGYANFNPYPVQFPLRSGRSAPITLDPGQPIVDAAGHLVPAGQEELDEEVRMQTIGFIFEDNPKHAHFKDWNKKVDQRARTPLEPPRTGGEFDTPITSTGVKKPPLQHAPDVTVSATHPPVDTVLLAEAQTKQADAQKPDTGFNAALQPGENMEMWFKRATSAKAAVVLGNNRIRYDGNTFVNKKALFKYMTQQAGH